MMKYHFILPVLFCLGASAAEFNWQVSTNSPNHVKISGNNTFEFIRPTNPWPSFSLIPKDGGSWDFSGDAELTLELENLSPETGCSFSIQLYPGSKIAIGNPGLAPGEKRQFSFRLPHQGNPDFKPIPHARKLPPGLSGGINIDTSKVTEIKFFIHAPRYAKFRINSIETGGVFKPNPAFADAESFYPAIDDFGQFIHADWPLKIKKREELPERLSDEKKNLSPPLAERTKFGGWLKGPQLSATGFFRTEKYQGKWFLVDPEGRLFFSLGINSVSRSGYSTVKGLEKLYTRQNTKEKVFLFYRDNCALKYQGDNWYDFQFTRLWSWGFNTIGNWSDDLLYQAGKAPYTLNIPLPKSIRLKCPDKQEIIDPFDPGFAAGLADSLTRNLKWSINDPWCLGYFVGNELKFGNTVNLAAATLGSPPDQPAKKAMLVYLKSKYNNISSLNQAWNCAYGSWEALMNAHEIPDARKSKKDLEAFSIIFTEKLFSTAYEVVKKGAPNQLYLGTRLMAPDYSRAYLNRLAAQYCDVVSYNLYWMNFDNFQPAGFPPDKPVLITECSVGRGESYGFGTLCDPGTLPNARAVSLKNLFDSAARHPQIVGFHHFTFKDQSLVGRWDGENFQCGIVDVADNPDAEYLSAFRKLAENVYHYRINTTASKFF